MPFASERLLVYAARARRARWLLGTVFLMLAQGVWADDLYVICHPLVALQPAEIRDTFVGEKGFAGTVKLAPADNSAAQAAFLQKVLKVDASKYASIWTKKAFRDGVNPPPVKANDSEALAFVRTTPGACSYISFMPASGVSLVARY